MAAMLAIAIFSRIWRRKTAISLLKGTERTWGPDFLWSQNRAHCHRSTPKHWVFERELPT